MTDKEMEELKVYIRDCNFATFISLCEYTYEITKPRSKGVQKQPHKIFDERFRQIVLHEDIGAQKAERQEEKVDYLRWFIKKTKEYNGD